MRIFSKYRIAAVALMAIFALSFTNCAVGVGNHPHKHSVKAKRIPPGHAKKIHGDKSARRHAPGHNR